MKTITLTTLCFLLCCLAWVSCKKGPEDAPLITCESVDPLVFSDASARMALPDAFTPDGDGKNDRFRPIAIGVDTEHYRLTISLEDAVVYQSSSLNEGWNGTAPDGKACAPGRYAVNIYFRTTGGLVKDTCNYVTLLDKDPVQGCVRSHGFTYHFADQLDPAHPERGFIYTTGESLCK